MPPKSGGVSGGNVPKKSIFRSLCPSPCSGTSSGRLTVRPEGHEFDPPDENQSAVQHPQRLFSIVRPPPQRPFSSKRGMLGDMLSLSNPGLDYHFC